MNGLRRQSQMPHHRNTDIHEPFGGLDNLPATFDLYRRRAALLNQPAGIAHRFFHAQLECEEGHIRNDQGPLGSPAYGARVMDHHVQGHRQRRVVAQDNHS